MRINLTKQEIVNSIFMQIGYSKKIAETLLEDFFDIKDLGFSSHKVFGRTITEFIICAENKK